MAEPFRDESVEKVAGIEARGFILGAAVAHELGCGFVAIRKERGLLPGEKLVRETPPDYRQNRALLRLQRGAVARGDRIILVDDWCETGSQVLTAESLLEQAGGTVVGVAVIVDQLQPDIRRQLPRFSALVQRSALGPSG